MITWTGNIPNNTTLSQILYDCRRADGNNDLLLDSVSVADILEEADEILVFDALVSSYARLERKMTALKSVMERSGGDVKPVAMQITDPFKQNGVAQVAVVYELSDGQTVSVFFHNPDVNPRKIGPTDELISWRWLLLLWGVIGAVWAASGVLVYGVEDPGKFGDMFGAVNSLFSGLAFATLIYTTWMQREELSLQREELAATRAELEGQKLQLQQQNETFTLQRFEDSFFALLRMHREIVDAMSVINENNQKIKSHDCFLVLYRKLRNAHEAQNNYPDEEQALERIQEGYASFFKVYQTELGHYFRHLYHIIKFVKQANIENKRQYTSLVRAHLSGHEHILLFYNCLSKYGYMKFKPLVEEFSLLENMPKNLLFHRNYHLCLYAESAYGEDCSD